MEESFSKSEEKNSFNQNKFMKHRNSSSSNRYSHTSRNVGTSETIDNIHNEATLNLEPCLTFEPTSSRNSFVGNQAAQFQSRNHIQQPKNKSGKFPNHVKNENNFKESSCLSEKNCSKSTQFLDKNEISNVNKCAASQRGKIIGGRYIRKQPNQLVTHSSVYDQQLLMHNNVSDQNASETSSDKKNRNRYTKQRNSYSQQNLRTSQFQDESSMHYRSQNENSWTDYAENYFRDQNNFLAVANEDKTVEKNCNFEPRFRNNKKYNMRTDSDERLSYNFHDQGKFSKQKFHCQSSSSSNNYNYNPQNFSQKESNQGFNFKNSKMPEKHLDNNATQRELLTEHLNKGDCECLVCCEYIRVKDQVWHCLNCFHVFHLRCIRKWARSPAAVVEDGGWRCPACQSIATKVPFDYFCFCGKCKNPEVDYHLTPHSCGEICGRKGVECEHLCKELCHPGPCPPCQVVVQKTCPCGKYTKNSPCTQDMDETCRNVCEKRLNCGLHQCSNLCHSGDCPKCEIEVTQRCFCGKSEKIVPCTVETASSFDYSCGGVCTKKLNCSLHNCDNICHSGGCQPCQLSVEVIKTCNCGKTNIADLIASGKSDKRKLCTDPIPVCEKICGKTFVCGPKGNPHTCQSLCHEGQCPPCELTSSYKCRCGAFTKQFPCIEITPSFVFLCEKRCNRRKDCGRHKCLNNCCINIEHRCDLICNRKLSCGLHQCPETCHGGNCPTCYNVSFDELHCHCGFSVLYPPIHCGTRPPECAQPCLREHPCDHEVKHSCHSDEKCPPCTSLTVKWCYGKHKQCGSVMCFLDGISCGMSCLKPLPCGFHKCQLTCHVAPCLQEGSRCTQLCSLPRPSCNHPCGNQCHSGPCPDTPCKSQVVLTCPCGHRSETTTCHDSTKSYRLISVSVLASKMQEIKDGQCINLNDVLGKKAKNNKLQCNEECAVIERNKRLAVALQIQNPELSAAAGPPSYSEFLKDEAKKSPRFVAEVYEKINDLVLLAKQSKQKCRSYSFPAMNRDHRRVVHELAEFFGCETQSYDEEPKKNVVVTAHKTKCWLPFVSIMTVVQRDMGIRKGPTPFVTQRDSKTTASSVQSSTSQKKKIDYFDYNE